MVERFPVSACVIDDDAEFVEFLCEYLESRGCKATGFSSAEELLQGRDLRAFEFFIVDLMLPGLDGVDLISLIRARTEAGILVVSGRMGPDAFNSVLAAGADMFINKPVRFDQIYHSIASITRRVRVSNPAERAWRLDVSLEKLDAPGGSWVKLTPVEVSLLLALHAHGGRPVTRVELASKAGISPGQDHRNLDAAVFRLRRKIEREAGQPSPIRTVHGSGYQLSDSIEITPAGRANP